MNEIRIWRIPSRYTPIEIRQPKKFIVQYRYLDMLLSVTITASSATQADSIVRHKLSNMNVSMLRIQDVREVIN